jgi:hypothetical protein
MPELRHDMFDFYGDEDFVFNHQYPARHIRTHFQYPLTSSADRVSPP